MPCDLIRDKLICVKEWQYHRLKRTMWLPCLKDENYFRCRVCHSISNVPKTPELADDGDWISWIKNYNFGGSKNDLNVKNVPRYSRKSNPFFLLQSSSIILLHLSFNIHQFHKIIFFFLNLLSEVIWHEVFLTHFIFPGNVNLFLIRVLLVCFLWTRKISFGYYPWREKYNIPSQHWIILKHRVDLDGISTLFDLLYAIKTYQANIIEYDM